MDIEKTKPAVIETAPEASPTSTGSTPGEATRFFATCAKFAVGLLATILIVDRIAAEYLTRTEQWGGLGREVENAIQRVRRTRHDVRIVFLGDSVAHQLFKPGAEGRPDVLFLTTNQAISTAGQYYLAESAIDHCPALADIYFVNMPGSWGNNLPRNLTRDYFCGHFHKAAQVVELFKVKRDFELSIAHCGRWLMPNIMAVNSLTQPAFALAPSSNAKAAGVDTANVAPPPDPESLISRFSKLCAPVPASAPPVPPNCVATTLSPVSRYYLGKLRDDCRRHGIRLHVLPCPISDEMNKIKFVDPIHVYDFPIVGDIPASQLRDGIHFKREFVQAARDRMIKEYGLGFLAGDAAGTR